MRCSARWPRSPWRWRGGWSTCAGCPPHVRARNIVMLRVFPSAAAALVTLGLVLPGFVAFEPVRAVEAVGPALLASRPRRCAAPSRRHRTGDPNGVGHDQAGARVAAIRNRIRFRSAGRHSGLRDRFAGADRRAGRRVLAEAARRAGRDRCLQPTGAGEHRRPRTRPLPIDGQPQALVHDVRARRPALVADPSRDDGGLGRRGRRRRRRCGHRGRRTGARGSRRPAREGGPARRRDRPGRPWRSARSSTPTASIAASAACSNATSPQPRRRGSTRCP